MSHPVRDAWIEITDEQKKYGYSMSHPVRDAWIEILISHHGLYRDSSRIP